MHKPATNDPSPEQHHGPEVRKVSGVFPLQTPRLHLPDQPERVYDAAQGPSYSHPTVHNAGQRGRHREQRQSQSYQVQQASSQSLLTCLERFEFRPT